MLVGVCASGKTTIRRRLRERGITAKAIAQEHSRVADLYKRNGQFVVVLVASWQTVHRRRDLSWDRQFYLTEWRRLTAARNDAVLVIHTDLLTPDEVADRIAGWYDQRMNLIGQWQLHPEWSHAQRAEVRKLLQPS